MKDGSVLIIGAGAAGLAAARQLSAAGVHTTVLEARERPGGRIHTVASHIGNVPVELGAEFIHGRKQQTWKFIRAAKLQTDEVKDRHWIAGQGGLREKRKFWDELSEVTESINAVKPDIDFESFLENLSVKDSAKWLAREYVEGFHAAPACRMSIKALAKSEAAAERAEGTRQFRLSLGYSALIDWLVKQNEPAQILYRTVVKTICWRPGCVEIEARCAKGSHRFKASQVLVTVPLGVLKGESFRFEPLLVEKQKAIAALEMGEVVRLTLQFRSRFWPLKNFGFIHSTEKWLPTWWSDERGLLLTGWVGGPRAKALTQENPDSVLAEAIQALSRIFQVGSRHIRDLLVAAYVHDWSKDPYTRGAYSFTPVEMSQMPNQLGEPIAETLFFAGEATVGNGAQGTVHGAIASGQRAAREILKDSRRVGRNGSKD